MDKLQKILREYLNKGSERIDVTMVLALIQQCKKDTKEQLTLNDVSQQRELLKSFCKYIDLESIANPDDIEVDIENHLKVFNCA